MNSWRLEGRDSVPPFYSGLCYESHLHLKHDLGNALMIDELDRCHAPVAFRLAPLHRELNRNFVVRNFRRYFSTVVRYKSGDMC